MKNIYCLAKAVPADRTAVVYSVEAGLADNVRHFDHHKPEHRAFPCPANNGAMPKVAGQVVYITHFDADTFGGILRLEGEKPLGIDLGLLETIDLNGSSACEDLSCATYLFMVGLMEVAKKEAFPRCDEKREQDVTAVLDEICSYTETQIIAIGKEAFEKGEETYRTAKKAESQEKKVGLWVLAKDQSIDPSRGYRDGFEVVVVYRHLYQTISVYGKPGTGRNFNGQTYGGVPFEGHPLAAGSAPRGARMGEKQAFDVFHALVKSL